MVISKRPFIFIMVFSIAWGGFTNGAQAYIGPGAGFAILSSFLIFLVSSLLVIIYLFSWPFRFMLKAIFRKRFTTRVKNHVQRVIVVGLDGLDPKLSDQYMKEGKLPHFQRLKELGTFTPLSTSYPSISPVAWSSFMTGVDPSHHNIFDFLTRDPCTYAPLLSSAEIGKASRVLPIGKYLVPLGKPKLKLLRKSKPFWRILGEQGVWSSILRVPITFPPEKFHGVLLSGMCVPDLKGSQGTFSFYTTNGEDKRGERGGVRYHVVPNDGVIQTVLHGPHNSLVKNSEELTVPLTIRINTEENTAKITVCGQEIKLEPGTFSPWIKVVFRPGLGMKVRGICRFYTRRISPDFQLYVTPINIDPENPALQISHPFIYSVYLAKLIGAFGTLGLAEDTWALNEGVLDEEAFLKQAYLLFEEREKMFFQALERTPKGLCTCVFDTPDRIQHMFFRYLDKHHPANRGQDTEKYKGAIEDLYIRMDKLIGRVLEKSDEKTVVIVMSDHGFAQFKRGVNLNTWFFKNGYLALKDGQTTSGDWFEGIDWKKTKAFALGLTGIFINRRGRELQGIVKEGDELRTLKQELISKLTGLVDVEARNSAIREIVDTTGMFTGPYTDEAPDLLIGYNAGYRNSWACATGRVTEAVFEDNTKRWSGDHCIAPSLVPAVFFSNRKINTQNPDIKDIAPTVLKLFGVDIPSHMQGRPLIEDVQKSKFLSADTEERSQEEHVGS